MKQLKYPKKWLEESRGILMVVATVISTMTFQAVVNPPGGVWQENNTNSSLQFGGRKFCSEEKVCIAGTAVLGYAFPNYFQRFIKFNTISFLASVSVTLLLVSGYALHNRICMWLLSMAMCVTLTFMAITYLQVLYLVVPTAYFDSFIYISQICFALWIGLLLMVSSVMNTIRFLIWMVKKLRPAYLSKTWQYSVTFQSIKRKLPAKLQPRKCTTTPPPPPPMAASPPHRISNRSLAKTTPCYLPSISPSSIASRPSLDTTNRSPTRPLIIPTANSTTLSSSKTTRRWSTADSQSRV
ncbi:uncharacterized protein Pyn_13835 [Prunus yedoensis var. nudiflora]|uniref:PGG domain-containing protein n=1 Tax=Prunus yedoensis var. nudiflora TaxID=2094558 RepID=A0A314ULZ3_PRUYE|nr:uncharacterized protein Pyn_13835 [Prunus yedoensis var. nudiflora]